MRGVRLVQPGETILRIIRRPVIEEAFELARSGRYRIPSEVRRALVERRYTQAERFQLEGKATSAQRRRLCADARPPADAASVQPG